MAPWGLLAFICAAFIFVEARRFHQKRETKSHLCDQIYNSTNKIQCFCIKDSHNRELLRSAECYPVLDGIPADDPIWDTFKDLENASKISVSNSRGVAIKYIPTKALMHTKAITKLEIKYGNIETIEPFAFANLSYIRDITLTDNQIQILKVNSFIHLENLVTIGLDTNLIVEINRDVFIDLPSLEKIYLTSNKITTIHDKAFVHLSNLRELEIDRNNLFSLNSDTFSGLEKLEKLDLSGNSLEVIGDNTFLPLKNLRLLNLEGNKIQMLDGKAFNGLQRLQSLSLAHNALTGIDNVKIFEGLKSLLLLNFKGNKLRTLKRQIMAPILSNFYNNISSLNIEDNDFPCHCQIDWLVTLSNKTQSPHLKLSIENLKCTPSAELKDKWDKETEAEKSAAQNADYAEPNQGSDFEYYDDTQLNGQLFFIDVVSLLNCSDTPSAGSFTAQPTTIGKADIIKISNVDGTKSTTLRPAETPARSAPTVKSQGLLDLSLESTTAVAEEARRGSESGEKPRAYTTSRLATVSAEPLATPDGAMAADEARPDVAPQRHSQADSRAYTTTLGGLLLLPTLAVLLL